jgi:mRNA-degrading endonuclease YafQ of YafQ-DinJ toxin-antitoxin module
MEVSYTPLFIRRFKKLPKRLQDEVIEKIELFKQDPKHSSLKVHPLHGRFAGSYSFSVNYYHRVLFEYQVKTSVVLLDLGDHDI